MSRLSRILLAAVLSSFTLVPQAQAQLVGLNHVWTVPGLIETSSLSTVVSCTNSTTGSVTIGVEVYGPTGGYIVGNSTVAAPSGTVLIATGAAPNLALDVDLNAGTVDKGHGRILATTSKGVLCNAFLVDGANGRPAANLAIVKRTAQKGD